MSSDVYFNKPSSSGSVLPQLEELKGKLRSAHLEFSWRGRFVTFADGEQVELDHLAETVLQLGENAQSYQEAKAGCSAIKRLQTLYMFFDHAFEGSSRITQLIHRIRCSGLFGSQALAQESFEGPREQLVLQKEHLVSLKETTIDTNADDQPQIIEKPFLTTGHRGNDGKITLIPLDCSMNLFQQLSICPVAVQNLSAFEIYPDEQRFTITNLKFEGTTLEVLVQNPNRPIEDFKAVWDESQNMLYLTGGNGIVDELYTSHDFLGTQKVTTIYQSRMAIDLSHILKNHNTIHVAEHRMRRLKWDGARWVIAHPGGPIIQFSLHKKD